MALTREQAHANAALRLVGLTAGLDPAEAVEQLDALERLLADARARAADRYARWTRDGYATEDAHLDDPDA